MAQWIGCWISDQGVPGSIPRRCTFRCGLEQVTFTLCLVLVKPRKRWTDDRLGQTVTRLEITLCPRDLISRPDIMDGTVSHTGKQDYHKSLDEIEFHPDRTPDSRVSCP